MRALAAFVGRRDREERQREVEFENYRQRQENERLEYQLDRMLLIADPKRFTKMLERREAARDSEQGEELREVGPEEDLIQDPQEGFDLAELVRRGEAATPPGAKLSRHTI